MLKRIISECQKCINNDCIIAALELALTIPDICGKAEYPDAGNTERYIKWFNTYIAPYEKPSDPYGTDMPYSSGELIYNLRNSLIHQGTPSIDASKVKEERCKVDEFILTIGNAYDGGTSRVSYGKGMKITERMLEINVVNLCKKLCATASGYYDKNKDKFNFFQYRLQDVRRIEDEYI